MDPCRCVVIELELSVEDRFINYLSTRKDDYNWILRESMEDSTKVKACVWWRRDKEFFHTPLRSFLKRLKNKCVFQPKISMKMPAEMGVRSVCKGIPATITKYHLQPSLYLTFWRLLQATPPEAPLPTPPEAPLPTGDSNKASPPISKDGDNSKQQYKAIQDNLIDISQKVNGLVCDDSVLTHILQKLNGLVDKFTDLHESMARERESFERAQYDPAMELP